MHAIKILVSPWQNPKGIEEIKKEENKDDKTIHARSLTYTYTNEIEKKDNFKEEITRGSSQCMNPRNLGSFRK